MAPAADRKLQDRIIRALADAPYRLSAQWRDLELADPGKVEKFARFLARHFYYERVVHFFKYSRALSAVTGRRPEDVLASDAFNALFDSLVLGGRAAAVNVADLVAAHIGAGETALVPYLGDLLTYEHAMMVAEAGPRTWRGADEARPAAPQGLPVQVGEGTRLIELDYDVTEIFGDLLGGFDQPPQAPRRRTRLLVARSEHGRVIVAHSSRAIEQLLSLADGSRTTEQIVRQSPELKDALEGLAEWGALKVSVGS